MPQFVFAYHGGKKPDTPAEGEKAMAAWGAWFAQIGDGVKDAGAPVGQSHTVTHSSVSQDGGPNPLSGYSLIEAKDLDTAIELAKNCPMVADGTGSVEVAEVMQM